MLKSKERIKSDIFKLLACTLILSVVTICGIYSKVEAKEKMPVYARKISYKIKGSTLTISKGKKKVSKIKGIEKVKKLVVSNKIKMLPTNYFTKCKKINKLTVPAELKFIKFGKKKSDQKKWCFPKVVKTVEFSTDNFKETTFAYYLCSKYTLSKKSNTIFSKKGFLYKKRNDLNAYQDIQLFAVPTQTVNLDIVEGTTAIDFDVFMYLSMTDRSSGKKNVNSACNKIKRIVFPKTANEIVVNDWHNHKTYNKYFKKAEIICNSSGLFFLGSILAYLDYDYEKYAKCFGDRAKWIGDFLVLDGNIGLYYKGCDKEVDIPECIYYFTYMETFASCEIDSYRMIRKINGNASVRIENQHRETYFYNEDIIYPRLTDNEYKEYVYCKHHAGKTIIIKCGKAGTLEINKLVGDVKFIDENGVEIKTQKTSNGKVIVKKVNLNENVRVVIPNDVSKNFIARLITPVIV